MKTKRKHEGYLLIDNSNSPGLTDEELRASGLPDLTGLGRSKLETHTYTCSHCHGVVVMNPLRTRERAYCPKCDHYICDKCEQIRHANAGACVTFNQILEETQEAAARAEQRGGSGSIILT